MGGARVTTLVTLRKCTLGNKREIKTLKFVSASTKGFKGGLAWIKPSKKDMAVTFSFLWYTLWLGLHDPSTLSQCMTRSENFACRRAVRLFACVLLCGLVFYVSQQWCPLNGIATINSIKPILWRHHCPIPSLAPTYMCHSMLQQASGSKCTLINVIFPSI